MSTMITNYSSLINLLQIILHHLYDIQFKVHMAMLVLIVDNVL